MQLLVSVEPLAAAYGGRSRMEVAGVLKSGFIMMGRVCLEIDLKGAQDSRSINEFMDSLKGLPVLVRMDGSGGQESIGEELP